MTSQPLAQAPDHRIDWWGSLPFAICHLIALGAIWTGVNVRDVAVCLGLYYFRMWAITAGYHRYFSHRSYKTSRAFQFLLAVFGSLAAQKGVLWWAAHHRHHHRESDQPADLHSPVQQGFLYSHMGWIMNNKNDATRFEQIRDFAQYPELRFLNRFYWIPPALLATALFLIGGLELMIWGFFVSTVLLWHGTFTINSLSHVFGKRRYKTTDTSKNNWLLALITCGEGWHNNHHYHQNTANQGWFWWEVDLSYYVLKALSWLGLVWDLRTPSERVKHAYRNYSPQEQEQLRERIRFGFARPVPALARAKVAGQKVREVLAHAKEHLPPAAPAPQPALKRQ